MTTIREWRILVNGEAPDHGGPAHVYIRDDDGWFHLVVPENEPVGDHQRFLDGDAYRSWPREEPPHVTFQTVTIGATANGGAAGNNNGTAGNDTSIGSLRIGKSGTGGGGSVRAKTIQVAQAYHVGTLYQFETRETD